MTVVVPLWAALLVIGLQVAIVGFFVALRRLDQRKATVCEPGYGSGGYPAQTSTAPIEPDREHHLVRITASEAPTVHINRSMSALMAKRPPAICVTCRQPWPEPKEG